MIDFLTIGLLLGLSAGFAPGPLLMLVISETLSHGTRAGMKVALAPVVTDLPIILVTLVVLAKLSGYHTVLGLTSLVGGFFVLYIGYGTMRTRPVALDLPQNEPRSLLKGVLTNFLSPHPYLFWIGVGAPLLSRSLAKGMVASAAFVSGFYLALVGAKLILALAVGRSRQFLSSRLYLTIMRLLGGLLMVFALVQLRDGLRLLGWL